MVAINEGQKQSSNLHIQTETDTGVNEIFDPNQELAASLRSPGIEASVDDIPPERVLELLKHYRYHIAPWVRRLKHIAEIQLRSMQLDICDNDQYFGVQLLGLSTESNIIRRSILALAEASLHKVQIPPSIALSHTPMEQGSERSVILSTTLGVLDRLRNAVSNLGEMWSCEGIEEIGKCFSELRTLDLIRDSRFASSIYWLHVRLGRVPRDYNVSCLLLTLKQNSAVRS
jgi:hypothetical protein